MKILIYQKVKEIKRQSNRVAFVLAEYKNVINGKKETRKFRIEKDMQGMTFPKEIQED